LPLDIRENIYRFWVLYLRSPTLFLRNRSAILFDNARAVGF
jgi:hypothetical protein